MDNNKKRKALRIIVREVLKAIKRIQEASTTGGVAGYNTPNAFSGPGDKEKKKKRLVGKDYELIDDLEDEVAEALNISENRWLAFKQDESRTNNKKIADGTSQIRKDLEDILKYLSWCDRIRNNNDITKDEFHVRTESNVKKIDDLIDKIRLKLKSFKI